MECIEMHYVCRVMSWLGNRLGVYIFNCSFFFLPPFDHNSCALAGCRCLSESWFLGFGNLNQIVITCNQISISGCENTVYSEESLHEWVGLCHEAIALDCCASLHGSVWLYWCPASSSQVFLFPCSLSAGEEQNDLEWGAQLCHPLCFGRP